MSIFNKTVAVVIPCYKVILHIEKVVKSIPEYVDLIVLVNDCSPDNTGEVIQKISEQNLKVTVLSHTENQGVGGAMITGFQYVLQKNSDFVVKIDGDGQMDASQIDKFILPLVEQDFDFSKGNRFFQLKTLKNMPFFRRFGNLMLSFLLKVASGYWHIFDPTNGYFCIKTEYLTKLDLHKLSKRFFFESSLLIELYYIGAQIKDIPQPAIYQDEVSNLSIKQVLFSFPPKLLKAFCRRMTLRYFIFDFNINSIYLLLGFPLFFFGLIFGIIKWIFYSTLNTPAPTGTIMIAMLSIILGAQMILSLFQYDMNSKNPFRQQ
ncbi:MAG: glycosyltransferase family 2 protein [Bacteroidales bacterium]|jgi:glycosyltransferase involved in cell wall biosynthesis|nr:glycosyltransferase family 2 protein [Bacteroidales bacterium]